MRVCTTDLLQLVKINTGCRGRDVAAMAHSPAGAFTQTKDQARRMITLVDELYIHHVGAPTATMPPSNTWLYTSSFESILAPPCLSIPTGQKQCLPRCLLTRQVSSYSTQVAAVVSLQAHLICTAEVAPEHLFTAAVCGASGVDLEQLQFETAAEGTGRRVVCPLAAEM